MSSLAERKVKQMARKLIFSSWCCFVVLAGWALSDVSANGKVDLVRVPNGGFQPQALMDERGTLHLIYLAGDAATSDVFYVSRAAGAKDFSTPWRVNSVAGSAIGTGTVRGAQLAIGQQGRVHVIWNGSRVVSRTDPQVPYPISPLLYARMNEARTGFEPQRNLMQFTIGLDGGGSVAADKVGNVYVLWHGAGEQKGEAHRRVYLARSTNGGKTFSREAVAADVTQPETGVCACCGMRAYTDAQGVLYVLYRKATDATQRGMYLLTSVNKGQSFRGMPLDEWELNACPMSTVTMARDGVRQLAAWENNGQVFFAAISSKNAITPQAVADSADRRKHPSIAVSKSGETLVAWTVGTGWKKGGTLAWQLFDKQGKALIENGTAPDVSVWGLPTVVAAADGHFTIIY